jgi:hypothetical protein
MDKSLQNKLIIGGSIVVGLSLLGWYFYEQGKKTTTIATLPYDATAASIAAAGTSTDSSGVTSSNSSNTPSDPTALSSLATQMYDDMHGISWFTDHNEDLYNQALAYSDTDFVALYNTYNAKYQVSDGRTLTAMITSCWSIVDTPWATTKAAMLERLGLLNLP